MLSLSFLTFVSNAQFEPHAIGVRGGGGTFGSGGEISYQHGFGSSNRLELDLGWRGNNGKNAYQAWGISGIYHWGWNITDGLNWYVGPGAQLGLYNHRYNNDYDGFTINVGGQIGIEYNFNEHGVPLLLSIDTRPMIGIFGGPDYFGFGGALGLRYTF